jgi:DNA-binding protein H-NS
MALKSLSVDNLLKLKRDVEAALASKVREQRRELELKLSKLIRFGGGAARGRLGAARGPVAPKYRNPENSAETWAGRGLKPRWLRLSNRQEARRFCHRNNVEGGQEIGPAPRHQVALKKRARPWGWVRFRVEVLRA